MSRDNKTTHLSIRVTEALKRQGKATAAMRGKTITNVLTTVLEEYIRNPERVEKALGQWS